MEVGHPSLRHMKLTITDEERELLTALGREAEAKKAAFEAAVREFRLAFDMAMRGRKLLNATFVSLTDEGLNVEMPKIELVKDDPEGDAA